MMLRNTLTLSGLAAICLIGLLATPVAAATVTVTVKLTVTVAATVDQDQVRTQTGAIAHNFMTRRADQITANDPDITSRLSGRGGGTGPVAFTGEGSFDDNKVAFSTSLRSILAWNEALKQENRGELGAKMGLGYGSGNQGGMAYANGLDFWLQGKWSHLETDTTNNDIGLLYAGIDYKFSDSFLVGVLGQLDWSSERDDTEEFSVKGRGWMFGPYFVARLHDNLILDGRAAWGLSDNDIDPLGFYTDSFETERWLLKSQLTGDFRAGQLRFAPSVGILYFEDKQDSYVDSLGIEIPEQTVALGRLTFGPALEYNFEVEGGTTITPRIALKGIWDFEKAEILDPDTGLPAGTSESDLRGRIEAGLAAELADGFSVVAEGFYDGIGADDLEAYGGSARITVPLN